MAAFLDSAVADVRTLARELWRDGRGWILLAVGAGWFLSIGVRFVYPALVPFFREEFGIGLATTGLLMTALWGAYAVGHVPGGLLGDRIGEGNVVTLSAAIAAATMLLVSAAASIPTLFAGTIAFGLATALYGPTRFTIFTDIYAERAGSAVGLTMAAGSAGNTLLPIAATLVAARLSWRASFGAVVPAFLAVAAALWLTVPSRTSGGESAVEELSGATVRRIAAGVRRGAIPVVVATQACFSFMIQGFSSFYPAYLVSVKGLSPGIAATLFGTFFALGAVVQPLAGGVMDRLGIRRTLIGFTGVAVVGLWALAVARGIGPLLAVTALASALNGSLVVTQTYIADTLPADVQGTGLGALKAGWMLFGATSPVLIGVLGEAGHFTAAFALLAAVGSVGLALAATRL